MNNATSTTSGKLAKYGRVLVIIHAVSVVIVGVTTLAVSSTPLDSTSPDSITPSTVASTYVIGSCIFWMMYCLYAVFRARPTPTEIRE